MGRPVANFLWKLSQVNWRTCGQWLSQGCIAYGRSLRRDFSNGSTRARLFGNPRCMRHSFAGRFVVFMQVYPPLYPAASTIIILDGINQPLNAWLYLSLMRTRRVMLSRISSYYKLNCTLGDGRACALLRLKRTTSQFVRTSWMERSKPLWIVIYATCFR